jgi:hypothetical protein
MEFMARQPTPKDEPTEENKQRKKFFSTLLEVGPHFVKEMAQRNIKNIRNPYMVIKKGKIVHHKTPK